MYYSLRKICSYNYPISAVIGARGTGKTYAVKNYVFKQFFNNKKLFVWLRDTDEACEKMRDSRGRKFFADIKKKFPQFKEGEIVSESIKINGELAGYLMPISTYYKYKGNSYEDISTVVFDEFLPEKCQTFTANRVRQFINTIDTICRTRSDVRVFMLANALDVGNEIFDIFGIKITGFGFYKNRAKGVVLHYSENNAEFNELRKTSIIGRLIKNTAYDDEIINGIFTNDENLFYDKKPSKCHLLFIINTEYGNIRLYANNGTYYVERDGNRTAYQNIRFVKTLKEMTSYTRLLSAENIKLLKDIFNNNRVRFDKSSSLKIFTDVLT